MVPQSAINFSVPILFNGQSCFLWDITGVKNNRNSVKRRSQKPTFLPVVKWKCLQSEICLHLAKEVIDCTIFEAEILEVVLNSFEEIVLAHEEH